LSFTRALRGSGFFVPSRLLGRTPLTLLGAPCPSYLDSLDVLVSIAPPHQPWVVARGWILLPGLDARQGAVELTLRCQDEDEVLRFSTNRMHRPDVVAARGAPEAEWCGFEALAPLAQLGPGEYRVGARVCAREGSAAIEFDRTIRITTVEETREALAHPRWISVHVPKTGGRTFQRVLTQIFSGRVYEDRLFLPVNDPLRVRAIRYPIVRMARGLAPRDALCTHGHFFATRYQSGYPMVRTAMWFREPAGRIVSAFHQVRRAPLDFPCDTTFRPNVRSGKIDLRGFAELRFQRDVQSQFLDGRRLDSIEFVGIQEHYPRSLALFGKIFGVEMKEVTPTNINPDKSIGDEYAIDGQLQSLIDRWNPRDRELYPAAVARFEELCRRHGV
jgi:hypothetical protein